MAKKGETWKAKDRRLKSGWFEQFAPGDLPGIDLGASKDPLYPSRFKKWRVYDLRFGDGDATYVSDIDDETYYTVYASHLLEHLDEPETALKNWWRILQPGGHLIVCVPHRDLYECKKELPSRWAAEHKSFWLPRKSEEPDTRNFYETVTKTLPEAEVVSFEVNKAGYVPPKGDTQAQGEFSIEIILRKRASTLGKYKTQPSLTAVIPTDQDDSSCELLPLRVVNKKPVLWWVYRRILRAGVASRIVVATNNPQVIETCKTLDIAYHKTSGEGKNSTEVLAEVAEALPAQRYLSIPCTVPLITEEGIAAMGLAQTHHVSQGYRAVTHPSVRDNLSVVKVVKDNYNYAMYFSRQPIPTGGPGYEAVSVFQYTRHALIRYKAYKPTELELREGVEALRWLENGDTVKMVEIDPGDIIIRNDGCLPLVEPYLQDEEDSRSQQ